MRELKCLGTYRNYVFLQFIGLNMHVFIFIKKYTSQIANTSIKHHSECGFIVIIQQHR